MRALRAALAALQAEDVRDPVPDELRGQLYDRFAGSWEAVEDDSDSPERQARRQHRDERRQVFQRFETVALDAGRQEMLTARRERGIDPEAVDRVLRRLDARSLAWRR